MEDNALNLNGTLYFFRSWGGMRVNDVAEYEGNYYYVGADGTVSTTTGWKKLKPQLRRSGTGRRQTVENC